MPNPALPEGRFSQGHILFEETRTPPDGAGWVFTQPPTHSVSGLREQSTPPSDTGRRLLPVTTIATATTLGGFLQLTDATAGSPPKTPPAAPAPAYPDNNIGSLVFPGIYKSLIYNNI